MIKSLLLLTLSLLLLVGLGLFTVPWWGPLAFKQGTAKILRHIGFSAAEVSLDQISLSQLSLTLERLNYDGVAVSDGGLKLDYNYNGLRSRELELVTLAHPKVMIDLSYNGSSVKDDVPEVRKTSWDKRSERFPVKKVTIDDAEIVIRGTDWERALELDAQLTGREHLKGEVALRGKGLEIDARADALWPELSGRVTASAKVDELAKWVEFGRDRGWFSLPEGLGLSTEPVEIEAGAGFAGQRLLDWKVGLFQKEVAASLATSRISATQMEMDAGGEGAEVGNLDLKVSNGTAGYSGLNLSFDQLLASASSAEQIGLRLSGWELSGESGIGALGAISASAGDMELFLEGGWQAWHPDFSVADVGLRMQVEKAPLSLFTGLGSVSGSWQMEAEISSDEARALSLSTELFEGSLTASGVSLASKRLSVSMHGTLPHTLEAVLSVSDGRITWSNGGGRLTGLKGDFELASLMPLASQGRQTLQFASIEQGEFATESGQLSLIYTSEREAERPLQLEIQTTALGGKVRILVDGRISDPLTLSVRVFLDSVKLEKIAALFPQFEGRIEGSASGELALRLNGTEILLKPGALKLAPGTTGRFEYLRQGWLTQDPQLDPEAFLSGRDIVAIMKDPQGATALTELAMRDLKMSEFRLEIREGQAGEQSVVAEVKGARTIRGVTVPVVLDVPIRGDVKETINAVFEFNSRM